MASYFEGALKEVMMDREYYTLDQAATELNYHVDELVQLGAEGKLPIYVLMGAWQLTKCIPKYDEKQLFLGVVYCDIMEYDSPKYQRLHKHCLWEYFSWLKDAEVRLATELVYTYSNEEKKPCDGWEWIESDNRWRLVVGVKELLLRRKYAYYPTPEQYVSANAVLIDLDPMTPKPVLLSECKMILLYADLMQLKQSICPGDEVADLLIGKEFDNSERQKLLTKKNEGTARLELIYEITSRHGVKFYDELSDVMAWRLIVNGEFKSQLIVSISEAKKSLKMIDGNDLTVSEFKREYRRRFEPKKRCRIKY